MANFVLIHGGFRGGWIWKRVAKALRKEGHDVYTPTLTGLAERSHLIHSGINLSTHIQEAVGLIEYEDLDDVVLCGHSYAGMVISGVADKLWERLSSLVYLDAWFPKHGDSVLTLSPEPMQVGAIRDSAKHGGLAVSPIPFVLANARDQAMVDSKSTPQPLATMAEAIRLQGNHLKVKTKMYVLATNWSPNPFTQFYANLVKDESWTTRTIATGHDAMLDDTDGVATLLREAAHI
ncbi:alpha/beta fold hydrolase [Granulicella sp. L60]|uniref:alpha/beta fold hydrolase n=1 Tax=Granulicella sp. L60 TaxID=1641866 RepID=UPI00131AD7EC|nr:alpha/beta hydrolase [Granulicella sp. L60]